MRIATNYTMPQNRNKNKTSFTAMRVTKYSNVLERDVTFGVIDKYIENNFLITLLTSAKKVKFCQEDSKNFSLFYYNDFYNPITLETLFTKEGNRNGYAIYADRYNKNYNKAETIKITKDSDNEDKFDLIVNELQSKLLQESEKTKLQKLMNKVSLGLKHVFQSL